MLMIAKPATQLLAAAAAGARSDQTGRSDTQPVPSVGRRVINQEEIEQYEEADRQPFNTLYHILTGAAAYVLRKVAPKDESSGSG